jgi:DNA-nicking Smr family endonuclease
MAIGIDPFNRWEWPPAGGLFLTTNPAEMVADLPSAKNKGDAMKPSDSSGMFKPFKNLKDLIKSKAIDIKPASTAEKNGHDGQKTDSHQEQTMFQKAMADVKKISRTNCAMMKPASPIPSSVEKKFDHESVAKLRNLVKYGTGFIVSLTPEYIEGICGAVNPEIARRLHRGDFSIQAHIDLHGLGVVEAHETFDRFLNESIQSGIQAVLVIHGRGLSSPAKPILKTKVYHWLTTSPWHKWVIAFTSARLCDGGAGATYVLLRKKPLTKKFRKKTKKM